MNDWIRTNAYGLSYLLDSNMFFIQNYTVNGINLFIERPDRGSSVLSHPRLNIIADVLQSFIGSILTCPHRFPWVSNLSFADILWILGNVLCLLFCLFLHLSYAFRLCVRLTCTKIKTEIWISFSNFREKRC